MWYFRISEPYYGYGPLFSFPLILLAFILGSSPFGADTWADTTVTPSVGLSQRYDSNVFYAPPEFIPAGRQAWDLVTTASSTVEVLNRSRVGDSILRAGLSGSVFAYNTDLAFVSTNIFASSDVSAWLNERIRGFRLRLYDSFQYTPESPAFLTGGKLAETSDIFSRGIQGARANTFRNTFAAQSFYSLARSVGVRADYSFSIYRVGQILFTTAPGVPVAFFDTTFHSVAAGPAYTFAGGDTLFLKYAYGRANQSGEGLNFSYATHTLAPEYVSKALPGWTMTIGGGVTRLEQEGSSIFFSGRFLLATNLDRRTRVQISLSREAAPAIYGSAGALISNVAQFSISHGLAKLLRLTVTANYAYNETTPVDTFTFNSIAGSAILEYKLTRQVSLLLSQSYNRYDYTDFPTLERYATMGTLNISWK